ncbi:1413_t:CDS:2, partial [Acaulospora morrowiae]
MSQSQQTSNQQDYYQVFQYDFSQHIISLCSTKKSFNQTVCESLQRFWNKLEKEKDISYISNGSEENFFKVARWSPDGTCILTSSNDNILRIFDLPTNLFETTE